MNTVFKNPICGGLLEGKLGKKARSIWMSREGLGVRLCNGALAESGGSCFS